MEAYLITGTSRGIGAAVAKQLIESGNRVVGIARSENSELMEVDAQSSGSYVHLPGDLEKSEELPSLAERALGYVDFSRTEMAVLINNAGVLEPIAPIDELSPGAVSRHLHINLAAPIILTGAFLRITSDFRVPRTVVNITSGAANKPYPGWSAYCAGKAGIDMVTQVAASEYNGDGPETRIIGVAPGVVDTAMQETIRNSDESRFPLKEKFLRLKAEGALYTPEASAARIVEAIHDPDVKTGEIVDVRKRYP